MVASVGSDIDILMPCYQNLTSTGAYIADPTNLFDIAGSDFTMGGWVRSENTTNPSIYYRLMGKLYGTQINSYGFGPPRP
jgi:hypothetical protein